MVAFNEESGTWVGLLRKPTREEPLLQIENLALLAQSWILLPFRNLKQALVSSGKQKPTPIGVGFLLDVVPPGLEPGTL